MKAESKHKNFKDNICPFVFETTDVCPPKKQLCCFSKHEKPTMQGVDPCCRGIVGDVKALGCGFCKKYELLNTPPKTLRSLIRIFFPILFVILMEFVAKPSVCKAAPCFTKVPKACPPQKSSDGCKSSVCKRAEISKCPKPKFKVEVQEKPKKKPVGTSKCKSVRFKPCIV